MNIYTFIEIFMIDRAHDENGQYKDVMYVGIEISLHDIQNPEKDG